MEEIDLFLSLLEDSKIKSALDGARRNEPVYREISAQMAQHGFHWSWTQCREKQKKMKCDYKREKVQRSSSATSGKPSRWYSRLDAIYGDSPSLFGKEEDVESEIVSVLLESTPMEDTDGAATESTPTNTCEDNTPLSSRSPSPVPGASAECTLVETPSPRPHPTACDGLVAESSRKSLSDKRRTRDQSDLVAILKDMHEHNKETDRRRLEQCDRKHKLLEAQAAREAEMAARAAEQESYERERAMQMDERFLTVLQTIANALSHH